MARRHGQLVVDVAVHGLAVHLAAGARPDNSRGRPPRRARDACHLVWRARVERLHGRGRGGQLHGPRPQRLRSGLPTSPIGTTAARVASTPACRRWRLASGRPRPRRRPCCASSTPARCAMWTPC
jgi:hypothetical protein